AKLQDRENNNWDEFLAPVVFAYNTGCHSTTQYSPFQLLFGREARLPTEAPLSTFTFRKPNDYYEQLKKSMKLIHQNAHRNITNKQHQYKTRYDKQRADPHYSINDRVLIRKHGLKNKLEPKYSITPQIIIQEKHPVYVVKDETTQYNFIADFIDNFTKIIINIFIKISIYIFELHEFASSGIPDVMCQSSMYANDCTNKELIENEKCREKEFISKLKRKLDKLARYAAAYGSSEGESTSVTIEKQCVLNDQLRTKLDL
ncbi:unnamed protein product, partial [Adineta steineri]